MPSILSLALVGLLTAGTVPQQSSAQTVVAHRDDSVLQRRARLAVHSVSLPDALERISERSGVPVAFSPTFVPADLRVSCDCEEVTVAEALQMILEGTTFRFRVVDGGVVIIPETVPSGGARFATHGEAAAVDLDIFEAALRLVRQERSVAGTVVDEASLRPIAGAQVMAEGTSRGDLTDAAGRFRIDGLTGAQATLRVVMIGYQERSRTVATGQTDVRFALTQKAVELDEIVVTGTPGGTQKRALGNSVAQISASEITEVAAVKDLGQMLNARAPGVVVQPRSGFAGGGPTFRVRGVSSLSLNDQPLVYVDGVRVDSRAATGANIRGSGLISRLGDFNPEDIESIEIIKGPAAATLYGTEANNGVIQIFTKRGRAGERPSFSMSVTQGATWVSNPEGRFQPAFQQVDGEIVEMNLLQLETDRGTPFFRTGHNQRYAADFSGGSQLLQYYVGGTYDDDEGVMQDDAYRRAGLRANITVTPSDRISVNTSLGYTTNHTRISPVSPPLGPMFGLWAGQPRFLNGAQRGWFAAPPEVYYRNSRVYQDVDRITAGVQAVHRPYEWLTHRLSFGSDLTHEEDVTLVRRMSAEDAAFFGGQTPFGQKSAARNRVSNLTFDYSATGSVQVTDAIGSATSVGAQYYRSYIESIGAAGRLFPAMGLETVGATSILLSGTDDFIENSTVGFFVQQQFSWRDRLFLTGAVRTDDNSAFGTDFDAVTYPKVSASWVISEEGFWPLDFVNTLKLRGAYGASGQQPATFSALRTYLPSARAAGDPTVTTGAFGNPDLGPERGVEIEVGFEAGLFDDRLGLDFTWYDKRTKDAILSRPVAPSMGFSGLQLINAGEIQNWGQELQVTARVLEGTRFGLELTGNVAHNENEVLSLGGSDMISLSATSAHVVGRPIGAFFFPKLVTADINAQGVASNPMCDDLNGGLVACSQAPRQYLGQTEPEWDASLGATLTMFERLRLYAMADTKRGHKRFNADQIARCGVRRLCRENHYPLEYDPAVVYSVQNFGPAYGWGFGLEDISFVALREVSLSYTMPDRWAQRFGASRANLTAAARNLHTWHDAWSWSPEANYDAGASLIKDTFPLPAQFLTTVRLTF